MFLKNFYVMSYWFVVLYYIEVWFSVSFSFQARSNLCFERVHLFAEMLENHEILKFSWKYGEKNSRIKEFIFKELPMKKILKVILGKGDLLYEFLAETRLTVYRRLDIRKQRLSRADLGPHKLVNSEKSLSSYQCFARWTDEKCLGFVVERISKIYIDVVRAR